MPNKPKKIGVFLARFQPIHNAHLYVIETALKECDHVAIMLGSSNKNNMPRNPFDFNLRYNLLMECLKDNKYLDKVTIYELPDWSQEDTTEDDLIWGRYLYYNIVSRIGQKSFTMYYSDEPELIKAWFDDNIQQNVSYKFLKRKDVFDGLSSTKIREALLSFTDKDQDYLKTHLPPAVYRRVNELRGICVDVYNNPKTDFTMK